MNSSNIMITASAVKSDNVVLLSDLLSSTQLGGNSIPPYWDRFSRADSSETKGAHHLENPLLCTFCL